MLHNEFLDYYKSYCELEIWFKKIILSANSKATITVKDIARDFIDERNRILQYVPPAQQQRLRKQLNAIATSYHSRITHWTKTQRSAIDFV